jgi:hypothetical protein
MSHTTKCHGWVVFIDDLGWTDPGCCDSKFHETPHIDLLSKQSVYGARARGVNYSVSWEVIFSERVIVRKEIHFRGAVLLSFNSFIQWANPLTVHWHLELLNQSDLCLNNEVIWLGLDDFKWLSLKQLLLVCGRVGEWRSGSAAVLHTVGRGFESLFAHHLFLE